MMKIVSTVLLLVGAIMLGGCSEESSGDGEYVWKEQTDTMDRARQAEEMMKKKAEEHWKAIDEIGR